LIEGIANDLKMNPSLEDGEQLKEKIAVMLIALQSMMSLVVNQKKNVKVSKSQLTYAENTLKNEVVKRMYQLQAHQTVAKTTKLLATRLENLGYVKIDGIFKALTPDIEKPLSYTESLKDKFINDPTKLEEEIEDYGISSLQIKTKVTDTSGKLVDKVIDVYQDNQGAPVEPMKK